MTDYYISSVSGSDSNTGLSSGQAWATFTSINALFAAGSLAGGDNIYLERGSIWAASGTGTTTRQANTLRVRVSSGSAGNPITILPYGTGNRPQLNGNGYGNVLIWHVNDASAASNYITIRGLEMTGNDTAHAIAVDNGPSNWVLEDLHVHTNTGDYGGIKFSDANAAGGASNITIRRCYIHDISGEAVYFGTHSGVDDQTNNCTVEDCVIVNCSGEAVDVKAACTSITIRNNVILGCGSYGTQQIKLGGNNCHVVGNVIGQTRGSSGSGVETGGYWGTIVTNGGHTNTVERNLFYSITSTGTGDAAIELTGKNCVAVNNTIVDCARGINLDRTTGTDQVTHTIHIAQNNAFVNNTYDLYFGTSSTSLYDIDYNSYDDTANLWFYSSAARNFTYITGTLGYEANGITDAQDFAETSLYNLAGTSPLLNAGLSTNVNEVYDGAAPDIGWHEYGLSEQALFDADIDLRGLWRFEGAALGDDSSSDGADLTASASSPTQSGTAAVGDYSGLFTRASNQYFNRSAILPAGQSFSVGAWVRPASLPSAMAIVGTYYPSLNQRAWLVFANGSGDLRALLSNNGVNAQTTLIAAAALSVDTWLHFALVFHDGAAALYVNGRMVYNDNNVPSAHYGGIFASPSNFRLGGEGGSTNYFDGNIDDVFFLDRELDPAEVWHLYNNNFSPTVLVYEDDARLVSYWKFQQNATDSIGPNHLSPINGPTYLEDPAAIGGYEAVLVRASSQHFSISDAAQTGLELTNGFTLCGRATFDSFSGDQYLIAKCDANYGYRVYITAVGAVMWVIVNNPDGAAGESAGGTVNLATGVEFFWAAVFTGTSLTLYVDGVQIEEASTFASTTVGATAEPFQIGAFSGADTLNGSIDYVAVFDETLSAEEIEGIRLHGILPLPVEEPDPEVVPPVILIIRITHDDCTTDEYSSLVGTVSATARCNYNSSCGLEHGSSGNNYAQYDLALGPIERFNVGTFINFNSLTGLSGSPAVIRFMDAAGLTNSLFYIEASLETGSDVTITVYYWNGSAYVAGPSGTVPVTGPLTDDFNHIEVDVFATATGGSIDLLLNGAEAISTTGLTGLDVLASELTSLKIGSIGSSNSLGGWVCQDCIAISSLNQTIGPYCGGGGGPVYGDALLERLKVGFISRPGRKPKADWFTGRN